MGLTTSFMSLGRIFGPACAGFLFDIKMSYPFICCAIIMLISFLISIFWLEQGALGLKHDEQKPLFPRRIFCYRPFSLYKTLFFFIR
jgi:MFS family permease